MRISEGEEVGLGVLFEGGQDKHGKAIMVQGTASDVGKSFLVTALCRILADDGWSVAPFKAQNMNSRTYTLPDGSEMAWPQVVQAAASRIDPVPEMNPILLKPRSETASQVYLLGQPYGEWQARRYREQFYETGVKTVKACIDQLRRRVHFLIMEGAGSPVEVNLKDRDLVNMKAAEWADADVLLVADIDRGGVFASIIGTLELMEPSEQQRVKGVVINRFRGDVTLLESGLHWLEERTGVPVIGVMPWLDGLNFDHSDKSEWEPAFVRLAKETNKYLDMKRLREVVGYSSCRQ